MGSTLKQFDSIEIGDFCRSISDSTLQTQIDIYGDLVFFRDDDKNILFNFDTKAQIKVDQVDRDEVILKFQEKDRKY